MRIFNDKEVDELVFLDIEATPGGQGPNYELLADIASEAFMPFAYGGGVTSLEQARRLFSLGVEKVVINTAAARTPQLIGEIAAAAGSSSVVASIDVRRNWRGQYSVWVGGARQDTRRDPVAWAQDLEHEGAGEILLTSINRDGTQSGYDLELIRRVSEAVGIPVVAAGGAGSLAHFREAVNQGRRPWRRGACSCSRASTGPSSSHTRRGGNSSRCSRERAGSWHDRALHALHHGQRL